MANRGCAELKERLAENGFILVSGVLSEPEVRAASANLNSCLEQDRNGSALRSSAGGVYGARNVLQLWPDVAKVWRRPPLPELLADLLGIGHGLVRVLYFDKPPEQSWALPWHQDVAIAVKDNRLPSEHFSKPTTKAGCRM